MRFMFGRFRVALSGFAVGLSVLVCASSPPRHLIGGFTAALGLCADILGRPRRVMHSTGAEGGCEAPLIGGGEGKGAKFVFLIPVWE